MLRCRKLFHDSSCLSFNSVSCFSTFILAGTDTTSNALSAMMSVLAQRHDIQDRLREEILEAQAHFGEDMGYDDLCSLPYMDAFVRESLRLYVYALA